MLFINTRPQERAVELTQHLQFAGYQVVELPVLELKPEPYSDQLQQLYRRLPEAEVIVVVSPIAVQVGMQYLQRSQISLQQLAHVQWVAVGQTTAKALRLYGIRSTVPEIENSEGMLSLPMFQHSRLQTVAFWRGHGGRQLMMQQCQAQHVEVLNFVLYDRSCPEQAAARFKQLMLDDQLRQRPFISLVSSEAGWKNWIALCQNNMDFLNQGHYLVLGDRLYQLLNKYKAENGFWFSVSQVNHLQPDEILRQLKEDDRRI